jgi:hypothetical protein
VCRSCVGGGKKDVWSRGLVTGEESSGIMMKMRAGNEGLKHSQIFGLGFLGFDILNCISLLFTK